MTAVTGIEELLCRHAPQVLGALVRRYGHFDTAEDAVQEGCSRRPSSGRSGVPDNPRGWLIRVAARRLTDAPRPPGAREDDTLSVSEWRSDP
ncbi:sigma factor [Streptomyces sp. NPDC058755]|uniref:sigma factor n=1 Tax=Streptomyces sp. NPDC058755 TaxID=3346624 RepID=UPI0036BEC8C6